MGASTLSSQTGRALASPLPWGGEGARTEAKPRGKVPINDSLAPSPGSRFALATLSPQGRGKESPWLALTITPAQTWLRRQTLLRNAV